MTIESDLVRIFFRKVWCKFGSWMEDELYLRGLYRLIMGAKLDLRNPKGFNEKIQWLKLHDRKPAYVSLVDKLEVKAWVAERLGEECIVPTLGVWDSFDDIDFGRLPERYVLKCTHDSGSTCICSEAQEFDLELCREMITASLGRNFYDWGREWPYKYVTPRVMAEEYLNIGDSSEVVDYKFMCFNGKVRCIFTCTGRSAGDLRVDFFDLEWNHLPFVRHYPNSDHAIAPPTQLAWMIEASEKLAKDIIFVRVDFYEIDGRPYFGEMTFYPGCGFEEFTPEKWDEELGSWLELPIVDGDA